MTKIYGIFGFPLKHTLSPAMQEAAFEKRGIDAVYLPFELDTASFKRVARVFSETLLDGFNLTVPYKETVLPYLDQISKEASEIGAVNTVKRMSRKFWGTNTDWEAFIRALGETGFRAKGKKAVILGAGGAGRACVYGLLRQGVGEVALFNRHPDKAAKIRRDLRRIFPGASIQIFPLKRDFLKPVLRETDLLVNATSVGLQKEDSLWVDSKMMPDRKVLVCDLIYNPSETRLLHTARMKKCRTLNGLSMLLYQGVRAFEIWTGTRAPVNLMRSVLEKALNP